MKFSPHTLTPQTLGTSALAMITGWVALWSWRGLVENSPRFLGPALVCGLIIVAIGALARAVRLPWYLTPILQIAGTLLFVNRHYASAESWRELPTWTSLEKIADTIGFGAAAINKYVAPVSSDHPSIYLYLVVGSVGIMLAIDLLACGVGRVPLAGLPILLTLSIPISVLDDGLPWPVFVLTAFFFLLLLSTEETRRVLGWGRSIEGDGRKWDSLDQVVNGGSVRAVAVRIGMVTTVGALVLPLFVPVASDLFGLRAGQSSGTSGSGTGVQIVNPLVDLRRDLVKGDNTPLVFVDTEQRDPSYLRLTVLDQFNGREWRPSPRRIPDSNRVNGALPTAPGLSINTPGTPTTWDIAIPNNFETKWLPTPYPAKSVEVGSGDWRYDGRTLDIVNASRTATSRNLEYSVVAANPDYDAIKMNDAISAPGSIAGPNTQLPVDMPEAIRRIAREVTDGAPTDYQRAVRLQEWFREKGGFTYSTDPGPGSGMAQLARFITTDKVGYCEQFAASMAVMGRALGIPARVVVGFLRPEQSDSGRFVFTSNNLHAWPEMYFTGIGWVKFEPTPSVHTGAAPAYTTADLPTTGPLLTTPSASATQRRPNEVDTDKVKTPESSGSNGIALWLPIGALSLLVLLLAAAPRFLRDARRRAWLAPSQEPPALAAGAWSELQASAVDYGVSWPAHLSARALARLLVTRLKPTPADVALLEEFVEFVERARYARPFEITEESTALVLRTVHDWSHLMAASARPSRRRIGRFFPRSVLRRRTPETTVASQVGERV